MYIGQTSQAPIQRLRKHYCGARAGIDIATLHAQLLLTDISNWITIPVGYCDTLFQAGLAERQWWPDLHRWALNNIPPGISENDTPNKQRAYINSKMLHTLHELRPARHLGDAQRVKALQAVLRDTAQQVGLPFHVAGTVFVPNLSTTQKTVITNILRKTLRDSILKTYAHQALRHTVRIVRSNPHTVRSVFQSKAMAPSRMMKKPPCRCVEFASQANQYGDVIEVDGHLALIPVALNVGGHEGLRPNDPVPIPGSEAQKNAISGITTFCTHLHVPVPPLDILLPPSLFPESGTLLRQLRCLSKLLASFQWIRIVDKGSGEPWGFCSAWVREKVTEFMINEKFHDTGWTQDQWTLVIGDALSDMELERNKRGKLCILYVLAMAKSRRTGKWLFRGISASPAPILQQRQLRKGALAFTCMLRMLQTEITHNFQYTDIESVSGWLHKRGRARSQKWTAKSTLTTYTRRM